MPLPEEPEAREWPSRESSLSESMSEMALLLQQQHPSVDDTLFSITSEAVRLVPGASDAGITLVTGRRKVESRAATGKLPRRIDALQERTGEGPCLDAVWKQRTVHVQDMSTEDRWPVFAPAAAGEGVDAMLAFQLYTRGDNLGALNLYASRAHGFDDASIEAGLLLATHAAIALIAAQHEEQFQSALASRDLIGQAKGMIMERYDINAIQAFNMVKQLSQDWNVSVVDLAKRIVYREDM